MPTIVPPRQRAKTLTCDEIGAAFGSVPGSQRRVGRDVDLVDRVRLGFLVVSAIADYGLRVARVSAQHVFGALLPGPAPPALDEAVGLWGAAWDLEHGDAFGGGT